MIQKVLQVGSSAAITIPKGALKELGLEIGGEVSVTIDSKNKLLSVQAKDAFNPELISWTRAFVEKYRPALEALKDK